MAKFEKLQSHSYPIFQTLDLIFGANLVPKYLHGHDGA